jgi:hypothetical protein
VRIKFYTQVETYIPRYKKFWTFRAAKIVRNSNYDNSSILLDKLESILNKAFYIKDTEKTSQVGIVNRYDIKYYQRSVHKKRSMLHCSHGMPAIFFGQLPSPGR